MIENKRFVTISDTDLEVSIKDNLTKRYPFSELCDDLIQFNSLLHEVTQVCDEMNKLWEQTQRFEDHNNRLIEENKQLKADNNRLVNETAKVVAGHQRKVLDLIDDKIDELEGKYKFGQEVYRGCPMHNIRFGINILKELKKELLDD